MDKDTALQVAREFGKALESRGISAAKIILFGSCARGLAHEGSDIDLVVLSDSFAGKGHWERMDILDDALYELWKPIEATPMTFEEWERGDSMIVHFAKDGEVAYPY